MNHEPTKRSVTVTVLPLAVAAVLWAAVLGTLVLAVPRYGRAYDT